MRPQMKATLSPCRADHFCFVVDPVDHVERLPEKLPVLYAGLTR